MNGYDAVKRFLEIKKTANCDDHTASRLVLAASIAESVENFGVSLGRMLQNTQFSHHVLAETRASTSVADDGGDSDIDDSSI